MMKYSVKKDTILKNLAKQKKNTIKRMMIKSDKKKMIKGEIEKKKTL